MWKNGWVSLVNGASNPSKPVPSFLIQTNLKRTPMATVGIMQPGERRGWTSGVLLVSPLSHREKTTSNPQKQTRQIMDGCEIHFAPKQPWTVNTKHGSLMAQKVRHGFRSHPQEESSFFRILTWWMKTTVCWLGPPDLRG